MKNIKALISARMSNYAFWTSLFALIPIACQTLGIFTLPDEFATLCNAFLAFLVAAGLVNNPTTNAKWFYDDHSNCEHTKNENQNGNK